MAIDPITATLVATAVVGAVGAFSAGEASATQSEYQGEVARMNAKIADDNAVRALQRSTIEAQDNDVRTGQIIGSQEAIQGASGLSISSGSFQSVRQSTREVGRTDTLRIIQGGEVDAFNFRVEAANLRAGATNADLSAENARTAARFSAASSLIGGASSISSSRRQRFINTQPRAVPTARILR